MTLQHIEFLTNRRISITMKRYIKKLLDMLPGVVKGTTTSPTKKNMFDVDTTSRALNKKSADLFHSVIAKILWITKRGRTDLETAESFLCTRVANPIEDDWQKLERLLRFINRTREDKRIIGIHDIRTMNTFTDASYAIHPYMRGYTGDAISFGVSIVHGKISKQKINVKSST